MPTRHFLLLKNPFRPGLQLLNIRLTWWVLNWVFAGPRQKFEAVLCSKSAEHHSTYDGKLLEFIFDGSSGTPKPRQSITL